MNTIGNKIIVDKTPELMAYCHRTLTLSNPEFYKKEQMGFATYNTPKEFYLYEVMGEKLILPFGCMRDVWKIVKPNLKPLFKPIQRESYNSNINLYDYQEKACQQAISNKNGIIVMPCGSGKTQTALEMIARIGGRALWVTHTIDLLNQSKSRATVSYDVDKNDIGTITGGKVNIGEKITFATVQTLANIDLSSYKNFWDIVVVDECHKAVGTPTKMMMFYRVISSLCARYKYGLTATPYRTDGLIRSMFALLGDTITTVTKDVVKSKLCDVYVFMIKTDLKPSLKDVAMPDGTLDYNKLLNSLYESDSRNEKIAKNLAELKSNFNLILADRIEHLRKLRNKLGTGYLLTGKTPKQERNDILDLIRDGKEHFIFATYSLAKEGLDIPRLDRLHLITPSKNKSNVTQAVGRVSRKFDNKENAKVLDYVDDMGIFYGMAKKRKNIYKKLDIDVIDW